MNEVSSDSHHLITMPTPSKSMVPRFHIRNWLVLTWMGISPCLAEDQAPPIIGAYEVVQRFPHDPDAFTQGLVIHEGNLFESTGLNGQSTLRQVDLKTGKVLRHVTLPDEYFAEGLALHQDKLYQITWKSQRGFIYDKSTLKFEKTFEYQGEGWGLTSDGKQLIMSNGSDTLSFHQPETFAKTGSIRVTYQGQSLTQLNELEFINGEIFANVWRTDLIVRIDPQTGRVTGVLNLKGILPDTERTARTDVLNGIAYDASNHRLIVTGKRWPSLFEIKIKP